MLKTLVTIVLAAAGILIVLLALNTVANRQRRFTWEFATGAEQIVPQLDRERIQLRAQRLATSLTYQTISWEDGRVESEAFLQLHHHLQKSNCPQLKQEMIINAISDLESITAVLELGIHLLKKIGFPLVHSSPIVELTIINNYSLLYKIRGSKDDHSTLPYMLTAHLDVVPVSNDTWKLANPFDGSIIDGVIYGRGALDDKSSAVVSFQLTLDTVTSVQLFYVYRTSSFLLKILNQTSPDFMVNF